MIFRQITIFFDNMLLKRMEEGRNLSSQKQKFSPIYRWLRLASLVIIPIVALTANLAAYGSTPVIDKQNLLKNFLGSYHFKSVSEWDQTAGQMQVVKGGREDLIQQICGSNYGLQKTDGKTFLLLGSMSTTRLDDLTVSSQSENQLTVQGTIEAIDPNPQKPVGDEHRSFTYQFSRNVQSGETRVFVTVQIELRHQNNSEQGLVEKYRCELEKSVVD